MSPYARRPTICWNPDRRRTVRVGPRRSGSEGLWDPGCPYPLVVEMRRWGSLNASGRLRLFQLPPRYDFRHLRLNAAEVRARLEATGHRNVVAFQTRNPLHRVHEELTKRATEAVQGTLLLHPSVGMTKPVTLTTTRACGRTTRWPTTTTTQIASCWPCYRWRCGWPAPAKRSACPDPPQLWRQLLHRRTRSCQPWRRLDRGGPSMDPTTLRNWSNSTRPSASVWSSSRSSWTCRRKSGTRRSRAFNQARERLRSQAPRCATST